MVQRLKGKWMPRRLIVLAATTSLMIASCGSDPQIETGAAIDCAKANREFFDCAEANPEMVEESRWDICLPHSEPLLLAGVWVTDFEWNQFHEDAGQMPNGQSVKDYRRYIETLPELSGTALRAIDIGEGAAIVRVRFEGRRRLCNPYPDFDRILVDRVISWDVISSESSGSIAYGSEAN